jgi:hypothetical protein
MHQVENTMGANLDRSVSPLLVADLAGAYEETATIPAVAAK